MKLIEWPPAAQADVRRIDRVNAMRILTALHRFAETGAGDIKKLQGDSKNSGCASETTESGSSKSRTVPSSFILYGIALKPMVTSVDGTGG